MILRALVLVLIGVGSVAAYAEGPRQLLITVRYERDAGGAARTLDSGSASDERQTQQVQVTEGNTAVIRGGTLTLVPVETAVGIGLEVMARETRAPLETATGFEVLPRLSGDRVTLEIRLRRDTPTSGGGANLNQVVTTVSGRLGEWILLGGEVRDEGRGGDRTLGATADARTERRSARVKVDEIR